MSLIRYGFWFSFTYENMSNNAPTRIVSNKYVFSSFCPLFSVIDVSRVAKTVNIIWIVLYHTTYWNITSFMKIIIDSNEIIFVSSSLEKLMQYWCTIKWHFERHDTASLLVKSILNHVFSLQRLFRKNRTQFHHLDKGIEWILRKSGVNRRSVHSENGISSIFGSIVHGFAFSANWYELDEMSTSAILF